MYVIMLFFSQCHSSNLFYASSRYYIFHICLFYIFNDGLDQLNENSTLKFYIVSLEMSSS